MCVCVIGEIEGRAILPDFLPFKILRESFQVTMKALNIPFFASAFQCWAFPQVVMNKHGFTERVCLFFMCNMFVCLWLYACVCLYTCVWSSVKCFLQLLSTLGFETWEACVWLDWLDSELQQPPPAFLSCQHWGY